MAQVRAPGTAPHHSDPSKTPQPRAARTARFNRDILPIFKASCVPCHGPEKSEGKLRLDSEAAVLRGGVSGPAVIHGKSSDSLLVKRLLGSTDAPRMPLGADALAAAKIALIKAWIDKGDFGEAAEAAAVPRPVAAHPTAGSSPVFAQEIRPILAARCYACHGPDVQQNGLRLDSLAAALKGSENGKVIVPGDSAHSRLVRRLMARERPQMPYGGPPLSDKQIALIRKWIDAGAPGPDSAEPVATAKPLKHWAYIKPVRPPLPQVKNAAWCRNPIDYFVLARLEKEGLHPSPPADKETLLRRVSLDLIGLPPTLDEVDAFLADKSPNAYEKVVDRLLASPHFGERWARAWLDAARYADTNGYEKDNRRTIWKYRDWVIQAFNEDMSYREFTIEQIAGDMLPNSTTDQLIATGFHRNTMLNQEGGVDKLEYRWYSLIDRVNTTATVWLGTTLECAECHNHKFDPFTNKDYYRFLAFFDNEQDKVLDLGQGEGWVEEPELDLPTPAQAAQSKAIRAQIAQQETILNTPTPELDRAEAKWENKIRDATKDWVSLRPSRFTSAGGATLRQLDDNSILASGTNPFTDVYTVEADTDLTTLTGLRVEVLSDPSLPQGGPGRDPDGNFFLSNVEVTVAPRDGSFPAQPVKWKGADADESQGAYTIKNLVNDKPQPKGWAIDSATSGVVKVRQAVLLPDKPFGFEHGTRLTIRLKHELRHTARNIGRFRLSVTTAVDPESIVQIPAKLRPILEIPPEKRSDEQKEEVAKVFRDQTPLLKATRDKIKALEKQLKDLNITTALIMRERPGFERPWTYMHIRGSFLSKGEKVYADVPAILNPLPADAMPNRLGLAEWLVSDDNPLTGRVQVNRLWETLFGRGIVETTGDFGTQGSPPTHPELLDWLATEFMQNGWSNKKLLQEIVTSATYRQSSAATSELLERDPYNKLLARGPRFRVEAEMVRDIALQASGLLSPKIGGPSVFPYQPEGIWNRPYSDDKWVISPGEDRYRRGLYTFIRRTSPYPSLVTFDAPSREFCTVRRVRTNTPLQALVTQNDPVFFEAAQALGKRMMTDVHSEPAERATYAFRRALTRHPRADELDRILAYYGQQLERYRQDETAAAKVVGAYRVQDVDVAEQAAWTMVANVLLNLDETITKE